MLLVQNLLDGQELDESAGSHVERGAFLFGVAGVAEGDDEAALAAVFAFAERLAGAVPVGIGADFPADRLFAMPDMLSHRSGINQAAAFEAEYPHAEARRCGSASVTANPDGNGIVNGFDLAMLLAAWG